MQDPVVCSADQRPEILLQPAAADIDHGNAGDGRGSLDKMQIIHNRPSLTVGALAFANLWVLMVVSFS